jgi:hypothetical protein
MDNLSLCFPKVNNPGYFLYLECVQSDKSVRSTQTTVYAYDKKLSVGMTLKLYDSDIIWTIKNCRFIPDVEYNDWDCPDDVNLTGNRKKPAPYNH